MKNFDEITKNVLAKRDEHNEKIKKRNRMIVRIGVPAVSLCLALIVGIGMWRSGDLEIPETPEDVIVPGGAQGDGTDVFVNKVPETEIAIDPPVPSTDEAGEKEEKPEEGDEIWIEPQWAEKALYAKYPTIDLGNDIIYSTAATWIDSSMVGEPIIEATAYGYDIYTDTEYKMGVVLYYINGISPDAAVAVSYDGFEGQYAVYTDNWYYPETLGEFIDSLNLRENLTFGTIYHTFREYESYMTVEYKITDPSVIRDMLLTHVDLKNVANEVTDEDMSHYRESMSISVNVDILGIKNVSLAVTENGYISTNILGTRKLFYIGEDKAQEFFDYVEKNFEGVREELPATTAVTAPTESENIGYTVAVSSPRLPGTAAQGNVGEGYKGNIPPVAPSESVVTAVTEPAIEIAYE